jgi:hypothetical protein
MELVRKRLTFANVVSLLALFISLGGGAYALSGKNTVASDDIVNGQVKSGDIGGSQVKTADIAASQVTGGKVAAETLGSVDIGAGAIGSGELADGAVNGAEVADGSLAGADIDDSTLFNDGSLSTLDIDEPSLFNDNSLTGADIQEASLVGLARGEGRSVVRGGEILLGEEDAIPLAQGALTFQCGGNPALSWTNGTGATARMISSDRFVLNEEDDSIANNASLGVGNGLLSDGQTLAVSLSGTGALGRAEGAIVSDEHVVFFHGFAFAGPSECEYAIWVIEDEL